MVRRHLRSLRTKARPVRPLVHGFDVERRGGLLYVRESWDHGCLEAYGVSSVSKALPDFHRKLANALNATVISTTVRRDGLGWETTAVLRPRVRKER